MIIDIRDNAPDTNMIVFYDDSPDYNTANAILKKEDQVLIGDHSSSVYRGLVVKSKTHADMIITAINFAIDNGWFGDEYASNWHVSSKDGSSSTYSVKPSVVKSSAVFIDLSEILCLNNDCLKMFERRPNSVSVLNDTTTFFRIASYKNAIKMIEAIERTIELGWLK